MNSTKALHYLAVIGVSLGLAIGLVVSRAIAAPDQAEKPATSELPETQLKQSSPPPPPTNPGSSAAGGRRNPTACPQDAAIAPKGPGLTALSSLIQPGLTLAERPTFLVYVPKTSAKTAEFSLRNSNNRGVYRTTFSLGTTPDVLRITLPDQATPLEVGKQYTWSLAIICNPTDRVDDRFVTSTIRRIELDATRLRQIQQASARERVALYQKVNAGYDALATLFELQRANDPSSRTAWQKLLRSIGIDPQVESQPTPESSR